MNSLLLCTPTAEIQQHNAASSRKPPWSPGLTCFSISCLVLLSSSYLIFHWLSSPSSFSMFLLSASLSLGRGERERGRHEDEPTGALCSESSYALCTCRTHGQSPCLGIQGPGIPHGGRHLVLDFSWNYTPPTSAWCEEVTRPPWPWPPLADASLSLGPGIICQIGPRLLFQVLWFPARLGLKTWFCS